MAKYSVSVETRILRRTHKLTISKWSTGASIQKSLQYVPNGLKVSCITECDDEVTIEFLEEVEERKDGE